MTAKLVAHARLIAIPFLVVALTACQSAFFSVLNAAASPNGRVVASTHRYDEARELSLDRFCPAGGSGAPLVVFFYGGSWENGRREWYSFVGESLAASGVAVAIPDYRRHPSGRFPDFMHDGARAVAWAREHARDCGADPARVYLAGHSAGAQIAGLLATDTRYLAAAGIAPGEIAGMIGIAGPYDFLPITDATLKTIFGPEAEHPRSQPIAFVDGDEPPFLLLHGTDDRVVWLRNSERLAAKLEAAGVPVELHRYPGIGHIRILAAITNEDSRAAPTLADIVRYVNRDR
ncbi:MAG TPA: alpha/beta hydrolase [Candidatus Saccharimonadia bacterium]|nr:alpha/beta hydrolase [Candidatus Saccharimonadia bacterium]